MADDWYGNGRRQRGPSYDQGFRRAQGVPEGGRRGGAPDDHNRGEFWPRDRDAARDREMRHDYGGEFPEDGYDPDPSRYARSEVWPRYREEESPYGRRDPEAARGRGWWESRSIRQPGQFRHGGEGAAWRSREEPHAGYRGRGPRGYTRSDDRIREEVSDRLTDNPYLDASDVEVAVSDGEVTLEGTVDSRYAKRLAEDDAEDVTGVKHCQNNLRVRDRAPGAGEPTV